jgi:hypothetical protein
VSSSSNPASGGSATTNPDGTYTVTGVPAGTDYQVCFDGSSATGGSSDASGYVGQCYNNQPRNGTRTPVTVTAGATTPAINAALAGGAGKVSGTVTDAGGTHHGLEGVWVNVQSPSTGAGGTARTAADGSYSLGGLAAATDYQVCFETPFGADGGSADSYVDQCYNNQSGNGMPTPVTVTMGATTPGINAALAGGAGDVLGTVIDAGGTHHGLANVKVHVWSPSTGADWTGMTAADGSYDQPGLPAGTDYKVCFDGSSGVTGGSSDASGYVAQCYNNQPMGTPTPVTVTVGAATPGINAALVGKG